MITSRQIRKALIERGRSDIAFVKECGQYLVIKEGKIFATHICNLNAGPLEWYMDKIINHFKA